MEFLFQQQFERELLDSEKKRTIILLIIFTTAIIVRTVVMYLIKPGDQSLFTESLPALWLFPITIILFELLSFLYINARMKANQKKIPLALQYLNTAIEICLPSAIVLLIAQKNPTLNVLQSPAVFIYFIFIILSTLRLNFSLSLFCGLLASLVYISFSFFRYGQLNANEGGKAIILLFSGIASGIVANQIKSGINHSLKEAEKRHKAEVYFGQQISAEIAEKILKNDGKIESKRMNVAVLFIDIRNFTVFAAGKSPEEIVHYQNAFFSIVIRAVTKHNGIVHQFLGDGCMATFGAPTVLKNPAYHAVNAALEIHRFLNNEIENGNIPPTSVGIGIHTGEAVTGNIGTEERQQYSITGSVVILAARIEQLNKDFYSQILVSEDVMRSIGHSSILSSEYLGKINLKGWHQPLGIYKIA